MITKRVGDMYVPFRNALSYLMQKHNVTRLRDMDSADGQFEEWWVAEFDCVVCDKVDPTVDFHSEADYTMFLFRWS